VFEFASGSIK